MLISRALMESPTTPIQRRQSTPTLTAAQKNTRCKVIQNLRILKIQMTCITTPPVEHQQVMPRIPPAERQATCLRETSQSHSAGPPATPTPGRRRPAPGPAPGLNTWTGTTGSQQGKVLLPEGE